MFQDFLITPDDGTPPISFDAVISEQHDGESAITTHPVETGDPVTDHVRSLPKKFSVVGFVTELATAVRGEATAVKLNLPPPTGIAALLGLAPARPSSVTVQRVNDDTDQVQIVHDALDDVRARGISCSVQTSRRLYDKMLIRKISVPVDHAGGARMTVDFERVVTVESLTVATPKPKIPAGAPAVNKGPQTPTDTPPAQQPVAQSFGAAGVDSLLGR